MANTPREVISGLCVAEHKGGLVIFQPDTGLMFTCNHVGARIWSGLSRGLTIAELSNEIANRFGVSIERAGRDTRALVAELEGHGLIARYQATL